MSSHPPAQDPRRPRRGAETGDGTLTVEQIRQTLAKAKGDYQGRDPEGFGRKADDLVASLEAQYGEHVPVADSVKRLEKLSRETGAPIALLF